MTPQEQGYLDAYLQPCPGYGWQGGPSFQTQIVQMVNGRENRNAQHDNVRHQFSAPFQNITREAYRNIKQMHLVCKGMLRCFKFRDELDFEATDELFGYGDGVETEFQLRKISTVDGVSCERLVFVIEDGASIKVNGVVTAATIDQDRGIVTFAAAPASAAALTWSGMFAVWVRFNQDYLPFSIDNGNGVERFANGTVDLIEVSPPLPDTP